MKDFLKTLASSSPTPGGGGAAALTGSVAAALGAMVANLTTGKKKYAAYQEDINRILPFLEAQVWEILAFIEKDAEAFGPLAEAYKLPKDDPKQAEMMEKALLDAARVPLELAEKVYALIPYLEELEVKGSRLAVSDVAVAAVNCKAAIDGAVMNVYINAGSLKNREMAEALNRKAMRLSEDGGARCQGIYERIRAALVCDNEES